MNRIKELRLTKDKKQKEIAEELNIPLRTYQNYESGHRNLSIKNAVKLAEYYSINIKDLIIF